MAVVTSCENRELIVYRNSIVSLASRSIYFNFGFGGERKSDVPSGWNAEQFFAACH